MLMNSIFLFFKKKFYINIYFFLKKNKKPGEEYIGVPT